MKKTKTKALGLHYKAAPYRDIKKNMYLYRCKEKVMILLLSDKFMFKK